MYWKNLWAAGLPDCRWTIQTRSTGHTCPLCVALVGPVPPLVPRLSKPNQARVGIEFKYSTHSDAICPQIIRYVESYGTLFCIQCWCQRRRVTMSATESATTGGVLLKGASLSSTTRLQSEWSIRHLESLQFHTSPQHKQFVMSWRGFSNQDIRVLLLRLRKGRLLLSQQDKEKQTPTEDWRGVLALGAESLHGGDTNSAKPALSQWAAKYSPAGQRFIWRDLLAGAD